MVRSYASSLIAPGAMLAVVMAAVYVLSPVSKLSLRSTRIWVGFSVAPACTQRLTSRVSVICSVWISFGLSAELLACNWNMPGNTCQQVFGPTPLPPPCDDMQFKVCVRLALLAHRRGKPAAPDSNPRLSSICACESCCDIACKWVRKHRYQCAAELTPVQD